MTKKQIGRMIAFVLVVCTVLLVMCDVFELSDTSYIATRFRTFDNLKEDTVDAVWIGSSGVDRYWVSPKAYEEYGMTVYPLASDAMPPWLFTHVIDEIYTDQTPELIIIDARVYGQENTKVPTMDTRARRVLDAMSFFSVNRMKAAFKTMKILHQVDEEQPEFDLSLALPFVKYHTKWADEDFSISDNVNNLENDTMGFFTHKTLSVKSKKLKATIYDNDYYEDLDPITEDALYELLDYAEEKNIQLLFVETPRTLDKRDIGCLNTLFSILDERDVPYLNFSQTDSDGNFVNIPGIDCSHDFYNKNHVNYYGAEELTAVVSAYLDENYDFADHRTDEAVKEQWDGVYDHLKEMIKTLEEAKN